MHTKFLIFCGFIFFFFSKNTYSQDSLYARFVINNLASDFFQGRGYNNNNDLKAAAFIGSQFEKFKIQKFKNSYLQHFNLNVNTIIDELSLVVDKDTIVPGVDFLVAPWSCTLTGNFQIVKIDKEIINNPTKFNKVKKKKHNNKFILIDTLGLNTPNFKEEYDNIVNNNSLGGVGVICFSKNLSHSISDEQKNFVKIILKNTIKEKDFKKISINVKADLKNKHVTQNVIGYIQGETDTFIVYTAHYDHLGTMGNKVFFPGANDNAAGVAMVLDLAKTFAQLPQKPHYSVAFMLFSGEELGLLGSFFYVEHPFFPLNKIKFVVNLDVIGSGEDGIQIVNSTIFKKEYIVLDSLNIVNKFVRQIKLRGPAANSDHYPFYASGVPSFFVYSLGNYKEYHNIYDTRQNVPLSAYNGIFQLVFLFAFNLK